MPISDGINFLRRVDLFAGLDVDELDALANIADEYAFRKDGVMFHQRDPAGTLTIVRNGRLFAYQVDGNGIIRASRSYFSGDYFNDVWLFQTETHPETVKGAEAGRVIIIEQQKFLDYVAKNPGILERLNLSPEARQAAAGSIHSKSGRRFRSLKLLPDEVIKYQSRRTIWLLIANITLPLLIGLAIALLIGFILGIESTASLIIMFLVLLFTGLVVLWRILDWTNDYFVITNKHLIHHEYNLRRFQATISKTPIDQVQSVEVLKPNLMASLLNYGTARITTAAQSVSVIFSGIDNPNEVEEIITELQQQTRDLDVGRTQADIRTAFNQHFDATPAYTKVEEPSEDYDDYEDLTIVDSFSDMLSTLFERIRKGIGTQIVNPDGSIIYRKHPVTLVGRIMWPLLAGLVIVVLLYFIGGIVRFVLAGLLMLDFLWFIWKFEDWRNETYQITDRLVIDIDRQPFFFGVSRKQADLANVQNVNANKPGFLATIFNFGNVEIETAGASADITFESVAKPDRVQRDIFKRRDAFKRKQATAQLDQRRLEYAILADVYKQEQDLRHIPRRT